MSAFKAQVQNSGTLQKDSVSTREKRPFHDNSKHTLNECRLFTARPIDKRKTFFKENVYCFRCCGPKKHTMSKCNETVLCSFVKPLITFKPYTKTSVFPHFPGKFKMGRSLQSLVPIALRYVVSHNILSSHVQRLWKVLCIRSTNLTVLGPFTAS